MGIKIDIDEIYAAQKDAEAQRVRIRQELSNLEKENAALQETLEEYDVTLRTLLRFVSSAEAARQEDADEEGDLPRGTARKHIETVLNTFAREGKTASEIREFIRDRYKLDIVPNTLSVTLSRLKAEGLAKLVGQKWQPATPPLKEDVSGSQWELPPEPRADPDPDPDDL